MRKIDTLEAEMIVIGHTQFICFSDRTNLCLEQPQSSVRLAMYPKSQADP